MIFATRGHPDGRWATVKLTADQQEALVAVDPVAFVPVKGGWGRRGDTSVLVGMAKAPRVRTALAAAWRNAALAELAKGVKVT